MKKSIVFMMSIISAIASHAYTVWLDYGSGVMAQVTIQNGSASFDYVYFDDTYFSDNPEASYPYEGSVPFHIPETIDGCPVTHIGDYAISSGAYFLDMDGFAIPNSVTHVGAYAFAGSNLSEIEISDRLVHIGEGAFAYCHNLARVKIPASFCNTNFPVVFPTSRTSTANPYDPFPYAAMDVEIINGATEIGRRAFYQCDNIYSVSIPNSVTNIAEDAFCGCDGLGLVSVSDLTTWFGIKFANEYSNPLWHGGCLETNGWYVIDLVVPDSVKNVTDYAFHGCSQILSVCIPSTVTNIGASAFSGCIGLTNVVLSGGVSDIRAGAFSNCRALSSLTISDGVRNIGSLAFYGCESMTNIVISPSVTNIADSAFLNCPLRQLHFTSDGTVRSLPTPNRDNHLFLGWFPGNGGRLEVGAEVSASMSYTARWEKDGLVITSFDLLIPDEITVGDEYYNIFVGQSDRPLIGTIYDQDGDPIAISTENGDWYCIDVEVGGRSYNSNYPPPAGDCTITVYYAYWTGITGVSGSASKTIRINKTHYSEGYYNYFGLSFSDGSGYYGSTHNLGSAKNAATVMITGYGNYDNGGVSQHTWPSVQVRDNYWNEPESGHDYSIGYGRDGGGQECQTIQFFRAGDYAIDVTTYGYCYEDEYAIYDVQGVTDTIYVYVEPVPLSEITITTESDIIYTGEEIINDGMSGTDLFSGKLRLVMSDPTSLYVSLPSITNAGIYQLTVDSYGGGVQYIPHVVYANEYGQVVEHDCHSINYVGATNVPFTVLPRPVAVEQARVVPYELHCDGTPQTCSFVITNDYNGALLVEGRDYDVAYANNILAGTATATVTCKGNYTGTFSQSFEILPSTNVVEVLGLDKIWTTGGNVEWFAEWFEAAHDGVSCMRSGAIGDNQESWIETVVTNTGIVSFWWKASSEEYRGVAYDKVVFSVDGVDVASIGGEVNWTNVTCAVEGNGPHVLRWTYRKDASDYGGQDCAWLDEVQYLREVRVAFADGGATDGSVPATEIIGEGLQITLPDKGSLAWPKHRFLGWRTGDEIIAPGTLYTLGYDDVTFTAVWDEKRVSAPTIEVAAWYDTERTAVTMGCETADATIHYTLDGSMPTSASPVYSGSFYLAGSATIRAIAVLDDFFDSDVASAESVRAPWTPDECLNAPGLAFNMGGDAIWVRDRTVTHDGDTAMRSGEIGDNQTSWVETSVSGAGTLTFWWKVSSEAYKGTIYDYARFTVDGIAAVSDIGGEIDWRNETVTITDGGTHTFRWAYVKDAQNTNGSDCAWLDEVTWVPVASPDTIPPVVSDDEVEVALAGTADGNLTANVTNVAQYAAYRDWALSVTNATTTAQTIKESTRTWLSYAFAADALIDKELTSDDVKIESFTPASTDGKFEFTVSVKDVKIGGGSVAVETLKENLKKVLGIEGSATLSPGGFSSDNIDITFDTPVDGKARFVVTPPADAGNSFFMRVKIK